MISFFSKQRSLDLAMSQFCKTSNACIFFIFHSDRDACSIPALSSSTGQSWKLSWLF